MLKASRALKQAICASRSGDISFDGDFFFLFRSNGGHLTVGSMMIVMVLIMTVIVLLLLQLPVSQLTIR